MVIGIVVGVFFGFLVRPALDMYMLWRAQEEYRDAPFVELMELEHLRADADPRG